MNCFTAYISSLKHKDEIRKTQYIGKVSQDVFNPSEDFTLEDCSVVTKKNDDFVVLNLSDIHFTDYKYIPHTAPKRSIPTPLTVARLVKAVKPDLITITGDIVCGKSTVYSIKNLAELMEQFAIPWAPIFGNHDEEGNCDLNYLSDIMMASPHCVMRKGDKRMGVGNYTVAVADQNGKIEKAFIMLDCHREIVGEKCLMKEWLQWVTQGVKMLSADAEVSVFTHIPFAEYVYAYDECFDKEKKSWKDNKTCIGHLGEEIACYRDKEGKPINFGFFALLKEVGNVKSVFCGHDHLNAFSLEYEGIRLNYVMKISKSAGRKFGFDGGLKIVFFSNGKTELDYKTVSYGFMKTAYRIIY